MQITKGLHRVGSDIVNSYLIVEGDSVTAIDAGLPGYWKRLLAELDAIGKTPHDVRALILTHGDSDHIGFAARLHHETGLSAHIHAADEERARLEVKKPNSGWGPVKIRALAGFLWYSSRNGGLRIKPAAGLVPIADGEVLDAPGSPRIIAVPGHTPGSVAVHVPAVDAVFVGDAMTTRDVLTGATGPNRAPFTLEPAQAVSSLQQLAGIDATWVLPGHGPAWDGGASEAVRLVTVAAANAEN